MHASIPADGSDAPLGPIKAHLVSPLERGGALVAVTDRDVDVDDVRRYVQDHRDDLLYAIENGDPFVQSLAIAALLRGGDAELELAKRELERLQEEER